MERAVAAVKAENAAGPPEAETAVEVKADKADRAEAKVARALEEVLDQVNGATNAGVQVEAATGRVAANGKNQTEGGVHGLFG